jgi:hypothetical protein
MVFACCRGLLHGSLFINQNHFAHFASHSVLFHGQRFGCIPFSSFSKYRLPTYGSPACHSGFKQKAVLLVDIFLSVFCPDITLIEQILK